MARWRELPRAHRTRIMIAGAVQITLAVAAWVDLARRPADRVRGPKPLWAVAIAVNFAGPLAYFRWGRVRSVDAVVER